MKTTLPFFSGAIFDGYVLDECVNAEKQLEAQHDLRQAPSHPRFKALAFNHVNINASNNQSSVTLTYATQVSSSRHLDTPVTLDSRALAHSCCRVFRLATGVRCGGD
jgi:hypothetical protein